MSDEKLVAAFETWITKEKPNLKNALERNSKGNYSVRATQLRFEGFKAAYSLKK